MSLFKQSLKLLLFMTLLTGVIYPLGITLLGKIIFPKKAGGSIIVKGKKFLGSALIAQKFEKPIYFWPRPSSIDFNPIPSGATNFGPTSADLKKQIEDRRKNLSATSGNAADEIIPQDLLTASGSGLDPHISPEAAAFQVVRVAKARNMGANGEKKLLSLIDSLTEKRDFGVLGEPRVNVFHLNLALDGASEKRE
jgi:K+-transporting ATPase ATPase C chain